MTVPREWAGADVAPTASHDIPLQTRRALAVVSYTSSPALPHVVPGAGSVLTALAAAIAGVPASVELVWVRAGEVRAEPPVEASSTSVCVDLT